MKKFGNILGGLLTAGLAILLVCNLYNIAARFLLGVDHPEIFGWSSAVVISGSMEPAVRLDDMVVIHRQDDYKVRDIITFRSGGALVTHRIEEVTPEGFITRGDANNAADREPVPRENVVGRVVLVIPKVGAVIGMLRTPLGMTVLLFAGLAMIEVPVLLRERGEKRNAEE